MSYWKPGDRVAGRFVVEGFLASGGMAEIYVAEMTLVPGVKRRVALKRIHSNLAEEPRFVTMFLDEARVASQLQHPGVVPVRDVLEVEGELLLVLDYVPGWDLSSVLRRAREKKQELDLATVIYVARSIADTLDYVHSAVDFSGKPLGIVHRDVNPSNIHLAEDGTVRLLDFGVAKAAARMTHTATSAIKGKLAYLAPEQAKNQALDARADLYGLGLILFEMVTGTRAMKASGDLLLLELARAPKHRPVSEHREGVPAALAQIIARLLSIDPRARPARGAEVSEALRDLDAGDGQEQLRALVIGLMGQPARAIRDAQRPLDVALRAIAGLDEDDDGGPATREQPVPPPPLTPQPETATIPDPPRAQPARRFTWIAAAAALLLIFGSVILFRSNAAPPAAATPAPAKGFFRITSEPSGAKIFIDGRAIAETTPAIIEWNTETSPVISVDREDHVAEGRRASASAGTTTDVHFALQRKKGRLIVRSEPTAARVKIDDREAGRTPLELDGLARAAIKVLVEANGHRAKEQRVDLANQAEATLDLVLEADIPTGTLDVSSTPWARVFVDGKLVAESTPVIGLRLKAGEHVITLSNPRLNKSTKRTVEIKARERSSLIVKL